MTKNDQEKSDCPVCGVTLEKDRASCNETDCPTGAGQRMPPPRSEPPVPGMHVRPRGRYRYRRPVVG